MYRSDVRFVWSDDVALAYQIVGEGPIDLIYLPPFISNLDWQWEYPAHAHYLERLASFSRLICVDRRGWGCSDRVTPGSFPPLEVAADDLLAVMDDAGSERPAVFAGSEAGWAAAIAAATHPDRFSALVLYGAAATFSWSEETPWNATREELQAEAPYWLNYGTLAFAQAWIRETEPSLADDPAAAAYLAKLMRGTIGVGGGQAESRRYYETDIRAVLPSIQAPTLVLSRPEVRDLTWAKNAPDVASRIPNARLVELPGPDYQPWAGEADALVDEVEEFLTGVRPVHEPNRVLATVLFTDIVGSTDKAAEVGDAAWNRLLEIHDERARKAIERHHGRYIHTTGDGLLATFDGPARAVRCAEAIGQAVSDLDLRIRAGCHTGEIELAGADVRGIAVHIAARVTALAGVSEVWASSTVKDLVAGSGLIFEDAGEHTLKGVPDRLRIYRARSRERA